MIRELYQTVLQETSLNVTSGEIDALRKKNIVKSGCRVYDRGLVGVAGTLGAPTEETWAQAEANLSREIPCPWGPETGKVRREHYGKALSPEAFIARAEGLMETLRREFPRFVFSNKLSWTEEEVRLTNDGGLDYIWQDAAGVVSLLVRAEDSVSIFDTVLESMERDFDTERILTQLRELLTAHEKLLPMPEGEKLPVLFTPGLFARAWSEGLSARKLARKASPLCGMEGKQIFSRDFTLRVDRSRDNLGTPFFDAEGTVLPGDVCPLIENGVLVQGYADKKCAGEYGVASTSAGEGAYDGVPGLSMPPLLAKPSERTLEELLDGRPALYVMADGGDVTPAGSFASPVQVAYLYQNGRLLGRLPEFSIRGSLFDILGKDFLGCTRDKPFDGNHQCVAEMTLVR